MAKRHETGAEELRRISHVLGCCRESALDAFTAEQLVTLVRACWASGWDVYVDDLSQDQCTAALELGEIPDFFDGPQGLLPIPATGASVDVAHAYLVHAGRRCGCAPDVECGPVPGKEDRLRSWDAARRLRMTGKHRVHVADEQGEAS